MPSIVGGEVLVHPAEGGGLDGEHQIVVGAYAGEECLLFRGEIAVGAEGRPCGPGRPARAAAAGNPVSCAAPAGCCGCVSSDVIYTNENGNAHPVMNLPASDERNTMASAMSWAEVFVRPVHFVP